MTGKLKEAFRCGWSGFWTAFAVALGICGLLLYAHCLEQIGSFMR